MRLVLILASGCALGACSHVGETVSLTKNGVGAAVTAPLRDFNLVKTKIPEPLKRAAEGPYKRPAQLECGALEKEVAELDGVLGPDMDALPTASGMSLMARGSIAASDAALDAVRDLTTGWIPFRGVVRRLTGASENQDKAEHAVQAGSIRRAYLKGLLAQAQCGAAPLETASAADTATASADSASRQPVPPAQTPAAAQPAPAPSPEALAPGAV